MPNSYNPYSPPNAEVEPELEAVVHPEASDDRAPRPELPPGNSFVTVHVSTSSMEAETIVELLESSGIATTGVSNATGARIGIGESAIALPIHVPSSRRQEAEELIEAYLTSDADDEPVDDLEEARQARARTPFMRVSRFLVTAWFMLMGGLLLRSLLRTLTGW